METVVKEEINNVNLEFPALYTHEGTKAVAIFIPTPDGLGLPSKPYLGMVIKLGEIGKGKICEIIFDGLNENITSWRYMMKGSQVILTQ